jgi:hypothetical protein
MVAELENTTTTMMRPLRALPLPKDVLLLVFSHLSPEDLISLRAVRQRRFRLIVFALCSLLFAYHAVSMIRLAKLSLP